MTNPTARIREMTNAVLHELAQDTGKTVEEVLDAAVEDYRRKIFIEKVNAGYAALRADPVAWAEVEAERESMAGSLMDGLDPTEDWTEDGRYLMPEEPGE
jgi:hypothetical protein